MKIVKNVQNFKDAKKARRNESERAINKEREKHKKIRKSKRVRKCNVKVLVREFSGPQRNTECS